MRVQVWAAARAVRFRRCVPGRRPGWCWRFLRRRSPGRRSRGTGRAVRGRSPLRTAGCGGRAVGWRAGSRGGRGQNQGHLGSGLGGRAELRRDEHLGRLVGGRRPEVLGGGSGNDHGCQQAWPASDVREDADDDEGRTTDKYGGLALKVGDAQTGGGGGAEDGDVLVAAARLANGVRSGYRHFREPRNRTAAPARVTNRAPCVCRYQCQQRSMRPPHATNSPSNKVSQRLHLRRAGLIAALRVTCSDA